MNRSIRQAVASLRKARSAASWVTCLAHVTYALRQLDPRTAQSAFRKGLGAAPRARIIKQAEAMASHTKVVRAACVERAMTNGGGCECGCGKPLETWFAVMDHFLGGSGRRTQEESVETCWMLTLKCNAARTHNRPNAATWNAKFKRHCEHYGYRAVAHVEHAAVPRRANG